MEKRTEDVNILIRKAGEAETSEDAMRFSQAAVNSSHAIQVLQVIEADEKDQE